MHYRASLRRGLTLLTLLSPALACEDGGLNRVAGELELESKIDFGDVQVGLIKTIVVPVKNIGGTAVTISGIDIDATFSGSRYEFSVPRNGFTVQAGGVIDLEIAFRPFEAAADPYQSQLTIESDEGPVVVAVQGRGIDSGLIVTPNPVEFETVLTGSTRTIEVTVTNALAETVRVTTRTARGEVMVEQPSGTDLFRVEAEVAPDRSVGELAPGASLILPVTYRPTAADQQDRGRFFLSNCDSDLCEVTVTLLGRGTSSALQCTPPIVDFGSVVPGTTRTLIATCENVAADVISVIDAGLTLATADEFSLAPSTLPQELGPGDRLDLQVTFSPTQEQWDTGAMPTGTIEVEATGRAGPLDPVQIQLAGRAGGPAGSVLPEVLEFGMVALNTTSTKRVIVINDGLEDLVVGTVEADVSMTGAFSSDLSAFVVPPGGAEVLEVTFAPQVIGQVSSSASLSTNDGAAPTLLVSLSGEGVDLPPCAHRVLPATVQFGAVPLAETPTLSVSIENLGTDPCLLNDIDFIAPIVTASNAYELVNGPETNIMLAPGATHEVPIRYTPSRVGIDRATLGYYISDPRDSNPEVPIIGVGEPLLDIECPAQVTTNVGTPVTLTAVGTVLGANITGYQWTIVSAPNGGIGTPDQWLPDPPTAAVEVFLPFIVGTYGIAVEIFDDAGRTSICSTTVVAQGQGLAVTLTWNGTGDVDLHVHNQLPTPWFNTPDDCYYSNMMPIWDPAFPATQGTNPQLDFDNTSANGPENTRVSTVVVGQPYTVGVHNFASAAGRNATVDIYCGGVTAPTYTVTSTALQGTSAGDCTDNDFWRVATVVFANQGNCTVTPIDTYSTSAQACMAF